MSRLKVKGQVDHRQNLGFWQISRELLNGFVTNSHGRRVWSVAWMCLNVKVKGPRSRSPGTKMAFLPFRRPACSLCLVKHF